MDRLTPEQRRRNMQAIKGKGSKIESALAKALFAIGYRYRRNDRTIFGTPDIAFRNLRIAIFVDSEFWHGKDWEVRKNDHKSNQEFWHMKIERNMLRDKRVNETLLADGWTILRFWGKDVTKNIENCVLQVEEAILKKRGDAIHKKS
ncbi:MAG TPA: very short patch repair endonuclease [Flavobacterium sp.]|nr:very short patch repair endonuclease [Flavobacterium sp.]